MFNKVKRLDLSQWVVTKFYHYPSVAGGEIGEYEAKRLVILMSLYAILHKYYIQII